MPFTKDQAILAAQTLSISFDSFTPDDLLKGMNHELEHTDVTGGDVIKTAEIALAHLKEDGKYYEKLDKMENVKNAKELPQIFYAKHIREGVAYYPNAKDKMLLIKDDALRKMMPSFVSCPVFADHQEVEIPDVEKEADGYITDSFYNQLDGCYWVKGLAISDEAQKAIGNGWGVSNAYDILKATGGGEYNNVSYDREILEGVYNHLAIVKNPRYEWAKIYTPEQYKAYQEEKKAELEQLQNSKDKVDNNKKETTKMNFNIFKRTPVQNSDLDLENTMVETKNGIVSLASIVNAVDEDEEKKAKEEEENKKNAINAKTKINTKNGEKSVEELVKHYEENCSKKNDDDEDEKKVEKLEENDDDEDEKKETENKKKNEEDEKSKDEDAENKKKNSKEIATEDVIKFFNSVKNASESSTEIKKAASTYDSVQNQKERGQSRYGSKK